MRLVLQPSRVDRANMLKYRLVVAAFVTFCGFAAGLVAIGGVEFVRALFL